MRTILMLKMKCNANRRHSCDTLSLLTHARYIHMCSRGRSIRSLPLAVGSICKERQGEPETLIHLWTTGQVTGRLIDLNWSDSRRIDLPKILDYVAAKMRNKQNFSCNITEGSLSNIPRTKSGDKKKSTYIVRQA